MTSSGVAADRRPLQAGTQRRRPSPAAAEAADGRWLVPLLLLFVLKGIVLVAMIAPFVGHDEVDHYFYVARLAAGDGLGIVGEVDLPPAAAPYEAYVADYPTNAEVIQPPFYHALLVPLYLLAPGDDRDRLILLRLASIPIGAAVVWIAYLTARLLAPGDLLLRAGVPVFVALQPQFAFEAAIVNHDVLLIALVSLVILLALQGLRGGFSGRRCWLIGIVCGLGLWTKVSFALVLPVVGAALLLDWWDRRAPVGDLVGSAARALALPLLLISPWFLRSFLLYGDPTGTARLRLIPGFGAQAQSYGQMLLGPGFWRQMVHDFWGNYGWRQIPYDPSLFRLVWIAWGAALVGLAVAAGRASLARWRGTGADWSRFQRRGVALLACSVALFLFAVLYVGTIQFTQARFAFPAMIGFATLTLLGIGGWLPARARPLALPVLALALIAFQVVAAVRFILPFAFGPGGGAAFPP